VTKIDLKEAVERLFIFRPDEAYTCDEVYQNFLRWNAVAYRFKRGEVCIKAGTPAGEVVMVLSGVLHVRIPSEIGDDILMRVVCQSEYIGVPQIFVPEETTLYDIVSVEESEVVVINADHIRQWRLDPKSRPLYDLLARHLCQEIRAAQTKAMILSGADIAERLRRFLAVRMQQEKSRKIVIPGTLGDLTRYLSVNRSALSRVMNKLAAEGVLSYSGHTITVL